jgi:hypothetical protein
MGGPTNQGEIAMRKFMILITMLIISTVMCMSTITNAHAHNTTACVTKHEYNHLHTHMGNTRDEVAYYLGTHGTYTHRDKVYTYRTYAWCGVGDPTKVVVVGYQHGTARVYGWMSATGGVL